MAGCVELSLPTRLSIANPASLCTSLLDCVLLTGDRNHALDILSEEKHIILEQKHIMSQEKQIISGQKHIIFEQPQLISEMKDIMCNANCWPGWIIQAKRYLTSLVLPRFEPLLNWHN